MSGAAQDPVDGATGGPPARAARRRNGGADPLGTRALFSPPPDRPAAELAVANDPFAPAQRGRRALFDQPRAGGGVATLRCGACGRTTSLGWRSLARALLPSLWVPGRHPSRYVRCPACARRAWGDIRPS